MVRLIARTLTILPSWSVPQQPWTWNWLQETMFDRRLHPTPTPPTVIVVQHTAFWFCWHGGLRSSKAAIGVADAATTVARIARIFLKSILNLCWDGEVEFRLELFS
ncbi:hypothetical protein BKA61DRAFT_621218 [Leptodontidium sp. MPI-SDFR-AT-0119]|nr:hypothetical protein BKA61DRAFT_621218 [Leptodontidium sp. MPI-SDFR-AT-0119]